MRAHLRYARISPKKANLVASMVRNMPVNDALNTLERLPKKGASILHGVISSAAANAENNDKQQRDTLFIKEIIVNKGTAFRRFIPIARGRVRGINKWTSHLSVALGVLVPSSSAPHTSSELSAGSAMEGKEGEKKAKAERVEKGEKKEKRKQEDIETVEKVDLRGGGASAVDKTFDSSVDQHRKDDDSVKGGSTFQAHRQGGRGS